MVDPSSVISTSLTAIKGIKEVLSWSSIKRGINQARYGTMVIPIFGAGGVGKTTLSRIMKGESPLDLALPYSESLKTEEGGLKGLFPVVLSVAPGQKARAAQIQTIIEKAKTARRFGVINVVSNGYHSLNDDSFLDHPLFREGMSNEEFKQIYIENQRAVELERVKEFVEALKGIEKPFWVITIVTKQDMWWNDRQKVLDFYTNGEYHETVKNVTNQHEVIPVALTVSNFETTNGEKLELSAKGYDFVTFLRYLENMRIKINTMIKV
jgi:hypothetical protein